MCERVSNSSIRIALCVENHFFRWVVIGHKKTGGRRLQRVGFFFVLIIHSATAGLVPAPKKTSVGVLLLGVLNVTQSL